MSRWLAATHAVIAVLSCAFNALGAEAVPATELCRLPAICHPLGVGAGSSSEGLSLSAVEEMAVGASPAIESLDARARAARWRCLQAGLPPNPQAGYLASEVGNEGAAGQQGAYVSQQFVRGGKLGYAAAVEAREARRLEEELATERLRVLTDARTAFYDTYLAQLEVELAEQLAEFSDKASETSRRLLEAEEGPRTDVLQAEIESQRAAAARRRAGQRLAAAWRRLAALTGLDAAVPQLVAGERESLLVQVSWEESIAGVLATSPELSSRVAAIEKARCELAYQKSLAVPDVTAQVSVQYDDATEDTVTGIQVGGPIRLWNRNQGGIGSARAELTAAQRRLEATEQRLRRDLAEVYGRYQTARTLADAIYTEVLPRAEESLNLVSEGYEAGEVGFLQLLTAQRTYFQVSLESLDALRELNTTTQLLHGCLLSGSGAPPE